MKRSLTLIGLALAVAGWYAPWVTSSRQLAALTYNALDLVEFAKFVNRAGIATLTREWLLVPLVASALALALWANRPDARSRPVRATLTLLAAAFSLVPLPPYPYVLKAYASVEDRISFWLGLAGLLGIVLFFAFGRFMAGRWRAGAFVALALIGAVPAAWEFVWRVLPATFEAYASPAWPAWGFFVTMIGFVLMLVASVQRDAIKTPKSEH
jgi:hypothetical protein